MTDVAGLAFRSNECGAEANGSAGRALVEPSSGSHPRIDSLVLLQRFRRHGAPALVALFFSAPVARHRPLRRPRRRPRRRRAHGSAPPRGRTTPRRPSRCRPRRSAPTAPPGAAGRRSPPSTAPRRSWRGSRRSRAIGSSSSRPSRSCRIPWRSTSIPTAGCTSSRCAPTCPTSQGTGEDRPIGRIVVLEDTNDDGRMDRKTVFLDSLVLPRAVKVLSQGVLVAETPNLWLARDTNGDGKADTQDARARRLRHEAVEPGAQRERVAVGARQLDPQRQLRVGSSASARTGASSSARRRARDSGGSRATSTGACTATATRTRCAPSSCRRTTRCAARASPTRAASTSSSRRTWPCGPRTRRRP